MKAIKIILIVAALAIAAPYRRALADHTAPAATLLYLDRPGWMQASSEAKAARPGDRHRLSTDLSPVFGDSLDLYLVSARAK